jgi:hypothetical protein
MFFFPKFYEANQFTLDEHPKRLRARTAISVKGGKALAIGGWVAIHLVSLPFLNGQGIYAARHASISSRGFSRAARLPFASMQLL